MPTELTSSANTISSLFLFAAASNSIYFSRSIASKKHKTSFNTAVGPQIVPHTTLADTKLTLARNAKYGLDEP